MRSGHSSNATSLRLAQAAAAEILILSQGIIVCVLPDEDYLRDGGAALWIAKVEEKEETDTDVICGQIKRPLRVPQTSKIGGSTLPMQTTSSLWHGWVHEIAQWTSRTRETCAGRRDAECTHTCSD
eukprot:1107443-Pleurochrysis_carterae.AAC.1